MPFCNTCGTYFDGRGSHCTLHNPYLQQYYNDTTVYTTDLTPIKYRTGNGHLGTKHRHRKPLQVGFRDSYDGLDTYSPHHNGNLVHYNERLNNSGYIGGGTYGNGGDPIMQSNVVRGVASTFTHLNASHAITSLTYSVSPYGARSLTATANPDREQCPTCLLYFPDRRRLDVHVWEYPVGCEVHGVCMREEDVGWHAGSERHERCFVRSCGSVYRREGGWKGRIVEGHVKGLHGW